MLSWAREHDCPWDYDTCAAPSRAGTLEVIQWAREDHAPWGEETCNEAALGGHLELK